MIIYSIVHPSTSCNCSSVVEITQALFDSFISLWLKRIFKATTRVSDRPKWIDRVGNYDVFHLAKGEEPTKTVTIQKRWQKKKESNCTPIEGGVGFSLKTKRIIFMYTFESKMKIERTKERKCQPKVPFFVFSGHRPKFLGPSSRRAPITFQWLAALFSFWFSRGCVWILWRPLNFQTPMKFQVASAPSVTLLDFLGPLSFCRPKKVQGSSALVLFFPKWNFRGRRWISSHRWAS